MPDGDLSPELLTTLARRVFPTGALSVERVAEGVSTWVYRITYGETTAYLRILPEQDATFAPEVAVHQRLRALGVRVPEIRFFEDEYAPLQRSVMIVGEIPGQPLSRSADLTHAQLDAILIEAGRDLARINAIPVDGFGWVRRNLASNDDANVLCAEWPSHRAFALEHWDADCAYLAASETLTPQDIAGLDLVRTHHDAWLDESASLLAHGDFDTTAIYQSNGHYSGIIDFGEIRGAGRWYDLGHFHLRDGEEAPLPPLLPPLIRGYEEVTTLPTDAPQHIRFASVLINVRALARSLQKRPPNRYTRHQIMQLREDIAALRA